MDDERLGTRRVAVKESSATPALSLFLAYLAMAPLAAGALAVWLLPVDQPPVARTAAAWGAAILIFLSGVRRGLSFRTPGGPTASQIAMTMWLFLSGLAALALPTQLALALLIVGYASIAVLDPRAARRGEAPLFFARLRPVQMLVPVASLVAVLVALLA